jgi:hypothetical protein
MGAKESGQLERVNRGFWGSSSPPNVLKTKHLWQDDTEDLPSSTEGSQDEDLA